MRKTSPTQKHRNFIMESIGDKPVTDVAGIGPTYGTRLANLGIDKAYILLGQYLVLERNEEAFIEWLKAAAGITVTEHAKKSCKCISDWCNTVF